MKLKKGLVGETIDNCIRLYTPDTQFPLVEVYARMDENGNYIDDDAVLEKIADHICEIDFNL